MFWDDICNDLVEDENKFFKHYPQFKGHTDNEEEYDIEWFNKQQKPMSLVVFKEAVDRIMTNILWRNGRMKAQFKIELKNGEYKFGYLGGRGQSEKEGYRYYLVADDGSSQTVQYDEINSVLDFEITKYD